MRSGGEARRGRDEVEVRADGVISRTTLRPMRWRGEGEARPRPSRSEYEARRRRGRGECEAMPRGVEAR